MTVAPGGGTAADGLDLPAQLPSKAPGYAFQAGYVVCAAVSVAIALRFILHYPIYQATVIVGLVAGHLPVITFLVSGKRFEARLRPAIRNLGGIAIFLGLLSGIFLLLLLNAMHSHPWDAPLTG